jgi:hypothetical protein
LSRYPWRLALFLHFRRRMRVPANEPDAWPEAVKDAVVLRFTPVRDGHAERIADADLARLQEHRPDVLLRFGSGILKGPILQLPRHGVWGMHHGDPTLYRGQPPGFWELHDGQRVIGAVLQRLTEHPDSGAALYSGWFAADPSSLKNTLQTVLSGSTGWMAAICRRLVVGDTAAAVGSPIITHAPVRHYPDNRAFLRFLSRTRSAVAISAEQRERSEWNLGIIYQPISALLEERPSLNPRWLPPPSPGSSRSTPFGYVMDGQLNMLYTKRDRVSGASEIARLRPKRDNVLKRSRTMLQGDGGAAHPFVLVHGGKTWVVVERPGTGRTELHILNASNDALEFHSTLVDAPLRSPTLFTHAGRWWLLGTCGPGADHDLYIYHADDLPGPYRPHALMPALTDARNARPAGTPFLHQGVLYRPVSDRTTPDGQVAIVRVDALTPTTFRQTRVKVFKAIKGSPWSGGLGSISAVDGMTLVEGSRGRALTSAQQRGQGHKGNVRTDDRSIERDDEDEA